MCIYIYIYAYVYTYIVDKLVNIHESHIESITFTGSPYSLTVSALWSTAKINVSKTFLLIEKLITLGNNMEGAL